METPIRVAYRSGDRLFLAEPNAAPRELASPFANAVRERARRHAAAQGWKDEGTHDGMFSRTSLWSGRRLADPTLLRITPTGLGPGPEPGEIAYSLDTGDVSGVFVLDTASGDERRVFHGTGARVREVAARESHALLALSQRDADGSAHIAILDSQEGHSPRAVTDGDSVDEAPSWIPGREALVFQSAGIGRDRAGAPVGLGPYAVEELDLASGRLETRAASPGFDHLAPRVAPDGALYLLRRPYKSPLHASPLRALLDALLFPFRLLRALFGWLDLFSLLYSGRRLTSARGTPREERELSDLVIWGRRVDAERRLSRARLRGDDAPALVPRSWQVVRLLPGSPPDDAGEVVAEGVLAFDLAPDGSLLVTNGSAVDRVRAGGQRERLCRARGIEALVALR